MIYLFYVGLPAGLHKKIQVDLADFFRED